MIIGFVKFVMTNRKTLEYCQRSLAKQEKVDFHKVGIQGVRDFFEAKVREMTQLNKIHKMIIILILGFFTG